MLLVLGKPSVWAIDYQNLKFETVTVEDGLTQSNVRAIIQDSNGFMWFGTRNGADMYNGRDFSSFTVVGGIAHLSITNNVIMSFHNDRKGRLFIGAGNGLNLIDFQKNSITHLFPNHTRVNYHPENIIKSIAEDDSGTVWVSTRIGVSQMVEADDTIGFIHYAIDGSFEHVNTMELRFDAYGNLWMATMQGLYIFNRQQKNFELLDASRLGGVVLQQCITLTPRDDGAMWVGASNGAYLIRDVKPFYPGISFRVDNYSTFAEGRELVAVPSLYVNGIAIDKNQAVWITTARGLVVMPWDTLADRPLDMHVYKHNPLDAFSIGSSYLTEVYIDKSGLVWIGSTDNGLSVFDPYKFKFDYYTYNTGNTAVNVTAMCADENDNLWLGTYADGLMFYDVKINRFYRIPQASYTAIESVAIDKFGGWWDVVPYGNGSGIFMIDNVDEFLESKDPSVLAPFYYFGNQIDGFKGDLSIPHVVYFDDEGYMWLGTRYDGLIKFDIRNEKGYNALKLLEQYLPDYNDPVGLKAKNIADVYKYNNDTMFIGARGGGLLLFSPVNKHFFVHDIVDSARYKYPNIVFVNSDLDRNLWVGTSGSGVFKVDKSSDTIIHYLDQLESSIIESMLVDNNGDAWIGTNKGLSYISRTNAVVNYNIGHMVKGQEFNEKVATKLSDGRLVFGGTRGFNMFYVEDIQSRMNRTSHNTVLSNIEINHNSIYDELAEGQKLPHLSKINQLNLKHNQNNIYLEFAALSYSSTMAVQYQYMLEGYDKGWYATNNQRPYASYNNLPGGKYTFHVRSANSDGYWSDKELKVTINIRPPFWDTPWFKVGMVLSLALLIHLFTLYRTRQVKKHNQQLESMVHERTRQIEEQKTKLAAQADDLLEVNTVLEERQQFIEEQSEEIASQRDQLLELNATKDKLFSIIAHDLKNPFNTILGFSELLIRRYNKYSDEKKQQMLEMINSSTQNLYKFLENLLTWSRTQTGKISYTPASYDVYDLAEEAISILHTFAKDKGSVIRNEIEKGQSVFVDKNMIQTVIGNLVSNAIKYTDHGEIRLTSETQKGSITICCSDNGTGMDEDVIANLFKVSKSKSISGTKGETGTGLGLLLCKEFVVIHQGKIWAESTVGKGSRFYMKLKV